MNIVWFGLILYALIEAIVVAYRVYQKRRMTFSAQPTALDTEQLSSRSLPQETPSTVQLDPDLDRALHPPLAQSSKNQVATQSDATEADLSLAASLSVNELTQSEAQSNASNVDDLYIENAGFAHPEVEPAKSASPEHESILAEISQLDDAGSDNTIAQLQQFLNHPNDMVRVVVVFKLEEIAAKQGEKAAEAKEMLMQLSQDANPDVRNQAVLALTRIDPVAL